MLIFLLSLSLIGSFSLAWMCLWVGNLLLKKVTFLHNPVFIPSQGSQLSDALSLFSRSEANMVIDLGSGDGTALLALSEHFPKAKIVGVEINPWLVRTSRRRIAQAGLSDRVAVERKSLWQVNLADYDKIYLYGSGYIMEEFERKMKKELRHGAQLVSVRFPCPNLPIIKQCGEAMLYEA